MTIRDHVRSTLGETYKVLVEDGDYDASDKPDAVAGTISRALAKLTQAGTTEADITSEFARAYIADMACHYLIIQAIDYVAQRMSQSDSIGSAPGSQNALLQASTRQFYDRIEALKTLDEMLLARLAADYPTFSEEIGSDVGSDALVGPRVSSGSLRTEDPNRFPRITPRWAMGPLTPARLLDWLADPTC